VIARCFKHRLAAIYILYGVCIQTSVLFCVIVRCFKHKLAAIYILCGVCIQTSVLFCVIVRCFKHKLAAIYILYGVCIQTLVSFYVIQSNLVQMECVNCIASGILVNYYILVMICIFIRCICWLLYLFCPNIWL